MRVILAMVRTSWRAASSYRLATVFSLIGLAATVVPLYFVAGALQGTMARSIQGEGGQYFAFVLAGMVATTIITEAIGTVPSNVGTAATSGTLDSLFLTPTPPVVIFAGLSAYGFLWTLLRSTLLLVGGVALGASIAWTSVPQAFLVLMLLAAAYLPFGLLMTASQIAFRTSGPVMSAVLLASTFLGGVYYPVHVIPSWLRSLAGFVPLSYGLRAFRMLLLEGRPFSTVLGDVGMLLLFILVLGSVGVAAIALAFRYARRTGGLSQY
ncbi:MAG: ABC transporter permease [Gemmatimonadaceae bacterium]|nr:ABC transporter permease [Gemmatimonadaceae bacterium]